MMINLKNKLLVSYLEEAKSSFISNYERGLAEPKYKRNNSIYLFWSFCNSDDPVMKVAFEVFCKTVNCLPNKEEYYVNNGTIVDENYETTLHRFDLAIRLARIWVFA